MALFKVASDTFITSIFSLLKWLGARVVVVLEDLFGLPVTSGGVGVLEGR